MTTEDDEEMSDFDIGWAQAMEQKESDQRMHRLEHYERGWRHALEAFAWWKDGMQFVGIGRLTLHEAVCQMEQNPYYNVKAGGDDDYSSADGEAPQVPGR